MSKKSHDALREFIREHVKDALNEDSAYSYFGDMGTGMGGMGMGGAHYASADQMYQIFVKPFADVAKVAAGKTKEVSQRAQTLAKVALEAIATTLVPALEDKYDDIFEDEQSRLEAIRSEYADAYASTWEAFNEMDVLIAAFMYRPDLFLTAKFIKKAPKVAANILSVLSGGSLDNLIKRAFSKEPIKISNFLKGPEGPGMPIESVIREKDDDATASPADNLITLLSNPKVKKALSSDPNSKRMSSESQEATRQTLEDVFVQAQSVLKAKDLNDVQKIIGKQVPEIAKLQQLPPEQRNSVEATMLNGIKSGMRSYYAGKLKARAQEAVSSGVSESHPFVQDHLSVAKKIESL